MSRYHQPKTREQALAEALFLALMAPGEDEAKACALLAVAVARFELEAGGVNETRTAPVRLPR